MSTPSVATGRAHARHAAPRPWAQGVSGRFVSRRHLQLCLGVLWLLDAALQAQPFMFGKGFARDIISPAGDGQPAAVAGPVHWAASVIEGHAAAINTVFVIAQAVLGFGLLWRRTARVALAGSVLWGFAVWWLGEGLGGVFGGGMTLLDGVPGAALLYAAIAVVAWPSRRGDDQPPAVAVVVPIWVLLWLAGAAVGPSASALVGLYVLIALWSVLGGGWRLASAVMGAGVAIGAWVTVQDFGEISGGQATDPNTGPLIVLLAVAVAFAVRGRRGGAVPAGVG